MGCVQNCFLLSVNIIVLCVGLAVVGLSSYVVFKIEDYNELTSENIVLLPVWTLIGGIVLTVVGLFGCVGIVKQSSCLLRTYGGLVLGLFLMEVTCGVLLLIYSEWGGAYIRDRMFRYMQLYEQEEDVARAIDDAQRTLKCCGVNTYQDWFTILYRSDVTPGCCTGNVGTAETCYKNSTQWDPNELDQRIYTRGCFTAMLEDLEDECIALGIMAIALSVAQILCIIFACVTARTITIKNYKAKYHQVARHI